MEKVGIFLKDEAFTKAVLKKLLHEVGITLSCLPITQRLFRYLPGFLHLL